MKPLGPPTTHLLSAAEGWTELGNFAEATAELDLIPAALQDHPQVLDVRWEICVAKKDWSAALGVARRHLHCAPGSPIGWIHQGYAIRRAPGGGLQAAWDLVFPAMEKFPDEGIFPYNLACYACQMQQLDVARIMFKRALTLGDKQQLKRMALNDPDLKPLWKEFREL